MTGSELVIDGGWTAQQTNAKITISYGSFKRFSQDYLRLLLFSCLKGDSYPAGSDRGERLQDALTQSLEYVVNRIVFSEFPFQRFCFSSNPNTKLGIQVHPTFTNPH